MTHKAYHQRPGRLRRRVGASFHTLAALVVSLLMFFPMYWMLITSLKPTQEVLLSTPSFFPLAPSLDAYRLVLANYPVVTYLINTLVVTLCIVALQMVVGILAAYAFSKGSFPGKNALFVLVLGAMMVPIQVTFIPIYVLISRAGWLNTYAGLILPEAVSAYSIFLLKQSFQSVDDSYLEAGKVDGMNKLQVILHVLTPMCRPVVVTTTILAFINGWNAYFWPKMIITSDRVRTIALGIADIRTSFLSMEALNMNQIMAASCIAVLPILALFLIFQKQILVGFTKSAMK